MGAISGKNPWAGELCRAFGVDPEKVLRLRLDVEPNKAITVTVEMYVDGMNRDIIKTIKKVAWIDDQVDASVTIG